ncbi:MAG: hypothetical protein WC523_00180 [Patescibacteria group bacterium]
MEEFYIKNKQGKFVPVEIKHILGKELNGHLIVLRVGTDAYPATESDLDETADSFSRADFLKGLDNISIVITPYQIDVDLFPEEELDKKNIYLQITSGQDVLMLEEYLRKMYNNLKSKYNTSVVPTPLKVGEYRKVQEILKRCQIRKDRRGSRS